MESQQVEESQRVPTGIVITGVPTSNHRVPNSYRNHMESQQVEESHGVPTGRGIARKNHKDINN